MTFLGKIERVSHEDGLLASFSGPSPALNSVLMLASDQSYVGKVDGVLGSIDQPLIHIAHLDNKVDPNTLLEQEILIRPKKERVQEERSSREDRSSFQRDRRDSGRDNRRDGGRDNRRNDRGDRRQFDRRDDRTTSKQSFANNDWTCSKCSNSNFAFREKCNKCDAPREGSSGTRNAGHRSESRNQRPNQGGQQKPPQQYRKSRGKGPNHAHNRPPKEIGHRRPKNDDF